MTRPRFTSTFDVNSQEAEELRSWLTHADGGAYLDARILADGSVAALGDLLYTRSIVLGCTREGWAQRYCFDDRALATARFYLLESEDDVPDGHIAKRDMR